MTKTARLLYAINEAKNDVRGKNNQSHMLVHIGLTVEGKIIPRSNARFHIHKVWFDGDEAWISFSIHDNNKGTFESSELPLMTAWNEKGNVNSDSQVYTVMNVNSVATKVFGHDIITAAAFYYYKKRK
jgi:hypothetical protein